jgi:hypothetical protein
MKETTIPGILPDQHYPSKYLKPRITTSREASWSPLPRMMFDRMLPKIPEITKTYGRIAVFRLPSSSRRRTGVVMAVFF